MRKNVIQRSDRLAQAIKLLIRNQAQLAAQARATRRRVLEGEATFSEIRQKMAFYGEVLSKLPGAVRSCCRRG